MRTPLHVGNEKQLLFDDALTQQKKGFTTRMEPARPEREPVLVPGSPWEVGGLCGDSNMSVVDDGGVYRLWYVVPFFQGGDSAKKKQLRNASGLDAKTLADLRSSGRKYALCHATSKDGVSWSKPQAGVVEYNGSRKNNIVFVDRLGCTVFKDPNGPARERYKMIYGGGPRLPHVHLAEDVPVQKIYHAIYGAVSSDGIHWRRIRKPIVPWYTDTTNVAYWDHSLGKYVAFVRMNEGMIYEEGRTVTPDKGTRLRYRAIGRTESADFRRFPPPTRIMEPSPAERRNYSTGVDYYNSAALKYPFAAQSYFLFSSNFYHQPDTLDVHLCTSRDGVNYTRWQAPYIGLGPEGAFDSQGVYVAAGILRRGDELLMYYTGYESPHGGWLQRRPYSGGVGLVRILLDRFVSQEARASGGRLMTKPLTFTGRRLEVNMDANAGGCIKAELCDTRGRPLPGFTARDADWQWGNALARTLTWRKESDLSQLQGRPVRIHFIARNAKLYAFQFVNESS